MTERAAWSGLRKAGWRLGATALLMFALIHLVGWERIVASLGRARWNLVLLMLVISVSGRLVEASQMYLLLRKVDAGVRYTRVFLASSLATFYALIVPGDVFATGAKWANLAAATGRKALVLHAIAYNRFCLLLTGLCFGAVAILWRNPLPGTHLGWVVGAAAVAVLVVGVFVYHPQFGRIIDHSVRRVQAKLPVSADRLFDAFLTALKALREFGTRDHLLFLTISSLASLVHVAAFVVAAHAVGLGHLPVATFIWLHAILSAARQFPITISNLGVREGILIVVLAGYGVTAETAVALGLVLFTAGLTAALIGATYQFSFVMGWSRWKPQVAASSQEEGAMLRDSSHGTSAR